MYGQSSIFPAGSTPASAALNDGTPIEIGMKFRVSQTGYITGVRFYKGASNTGTHIGHLWSSTGGQLAEATFLNETASGWQQVLFPTPVAVTANTTYVISYFSSAGYYANTNTYFTAAVVNGPLRALADGEDGNNGVYIYSATSAFPVNSYRSGNYWVDIVYSPTIPDITAPTIISVLPSNGATNIAPNTTISATFSEKMNAATITASAVQLRNAANIAIPCTASYNETSRTVTVTPSALLANATAHTVTIAGNVTDSAGNPLGDNYSWSFTTVAADDTTPPTITSVTPSDGATGVATGTAITAVFSEKMDASTIKGATVQLRNALNIAVGAVVSYDAATRTVKLVPSSSLANLAIYTASIVGGSSGVKDSAGNALAGDYSWTFTTGLPDLIPPTVSSVTPTGGATGVLVNSKPTVLFSENMMSSTITAGTILVRNSSNALISAVVNYNPVNRTATITPSALLAYSTKYKVTVSAGTNGVKDSSGNALLLNYTWSFTTSAADLTPPTVTAKSPANGATGVATTVSITATFSEKMNAATISTTTVTLRDPSNTSIPCTVTYNSSTKKLTLAPSLPLANSKVYTVTIIGGASGVKDSAGNALASNFTWSFTTVADTAPPTVVNVSPANGATAVSSATTVTAVFSEAMKAVSFSGSTVELRTAANALVAASISYDSVSKTVILIPSAPLSAAATYTARIIGGASGVKDMAGNSLASTYSWTFTTVSITSYNIFSSSTTPAVPLANDGTGIEVGVKFRVTQAGYITGVRFYKGAGSTGTHTGHLWSSTGTKLAEAVFSETASGWQQVSFSAPVAVNTGVTYIASCFSSSGHYCLTNPFFTAAVVNGPLRALANGEDGGNGLYSYTASGAFPVNNFQSSNYWVDVVFSTSTGPDTVPPSVIAVSPAGGSTGAGVNSTITATFTESVDPASLTGSSFELRNTSTNAVIAAAVTYNAAANTAVLTPSSALAYNTSYTAKVKGGATGVDDIAGNAMTADYSWTFTTSDTPPTEGPGGPILVVSNSANPFSRYTAEILRAEGLNEFAAADISAVTSTMLNNYDVVLLGEMTVTSAQVTLLTNWVNAGGILVVFKPSSLLLPLCGLTSSTGTLADKYLLVKTSSGPGVGIVNQTIQFHGTANLHTLSNGATAIATLYSSATAATANPAVTTRTVGSNGGKVFAFTFDLSKSVVYTRQGNPALAGVETDGQAGPIRPDDLYYPTYLDMNKVAIPQADEQQRLLANIILQGNLINKPLPRFWYLPKDYKAAIIYALDDHGTSSGTKDIFDKMIANSTVGCSVDNWECLRATSWFYVGIPLTNASANNYRSQGFEMGVHAQNGCANFSSFSDLDGYYNAQLQQFQATYPALPPQTTHRFHCLAWSDWLTQARVELSHGIRLSLDYYYWPPSWINGRPGMFTGSGLPMRFANTDGTMLDIYQGVSQIVNENGIAYATDVNTLLDNALGSAGYYGMFGAHDDYRDNTFSNTLIASAKARNVPVISALQALTWLDGRNGSYFQNIAWNSNQLTFNIFARSGANNLRAMLPVNSGSGQLSSITMNGSAITYVTQTIKGISYAFFAAPAGTNAFVATYGQSARVTARTVESEEIAGETADVSPVEATVTDAKILSPSKGATASAMKSPAASAMLDIKVKPNPSPDYFDLVINGARQGTIAIKITDLSGRVVEAQAAIAPGRIVRVGQNWAAGSYMAEIVQGDQRKMIKLIKVN